VADSRRNVTVEIRPVSTVPGYVVYHQALDVSGQSLFSCVLNLPPSSFCQYFDRARCAGLRAGLAAARHRVREAHAPGCGPRAVYKGGRELPGEAEPYVNLMFGLASV